MTESREKFPGKVLFVDDHYSMRRVLARLAEVDGVEDVEVFEDADSAVKRLNELEETVVAIFSDGLNGDWKKVVATAKETGVPAIVLSNAPLRQQAEESGAAFISKSDLRPGVVAATLAGLKNPSDD